jgi:curved DNA-binding protein CbpA
MVGQSLEHSFKALGLRLGATETEFKVRYRAHAQIYHPNKHNPTRTGMTQEAAANYFKLINSAQAYLCKVLWHLWLKLRNLQRNLHETT